jgi:hypothetical protein
MKAPSLKAPSLPARRAAPAVHFRGEIEKAEAAGFAREDMVLRLTLTDVSKLKRDTSLAVADISFSGGAMQFLGVKVEWGGVAESVLQHPELDQPALKR